jgi:drug/metabolite transporter (DMT)-like permease
VAIVAVLGSLYPVAIVALAHGLLGERVSRVQRAGIALALAGVAVVATA